MKEPAAISNTPAKSMKSIPSNDVPKKIGTSSSMNPATEKPPPNHAPLQTPKSIETPATSVTSTPHTPENEKHSVKAKVNRL